MQGKYIVDALTIYKHVADIRDAENSNHFDAFLIEDGRALSVTMPSIPTYFLKNMGDMKHNESPDPIEEIFLDHSIKLTAVMADRSRQKKTVKMYFPDGMTCSTEYFNGRSNKGTNRVQQNIRLIKTCSIKSKSGEEIPILASYASWTVAIEGSSNSTMTEDDLDDGSNPIADALKHMTM